MISQFVSRLVSLFALIFFLGFLFVCAGFFSLARAEEGVEHTTSHQKPWQGEICAGGMFFATSFRTQEEVQHTHLIFEACGEMWWKHKLMLAMGVALTPIPMPYIELEFRQKEASWFFLAEARTGYLHRFHADGFALAGWQGKYASIGFGAGIWPVHHHYGAGGTIMARAHIDDPIEIRAFIAVGHTWGTEPQVSVTGGGEILVRWQIKRKEKPPKEEVLAGG